MEWVRFVNSADRPREFTVKVVQAAAEDALLEIYVLPLSGRSVELDPYTPEDSVFGQQAVKQALVVGAAAPGGKNLTVQEYSSRGPALIGTCLELERPDLVAPDHTVLTVQCNLRSLRGQCSRSYCRACNLCYEWVFGYEEKSGR